MNTRFNPTCNGPLHVGHLYMVLVNYHMAKASGGKFIVRFDDDQPYWIERLGRDGLQKFSEGMQEDLAWFGLQVDEWTYESKAREANEAMAAGLLMPNITPTDADFAKMPGGCWTYPYVPYLTLVKVIQDHREGIDTLIRGEDLVTEFALYHYFCHILKIPVPTLYYLPRLRQLVHSFWGMGAKELELSDVSKTAGNCKLAEFRERGWTPTQVTNMLAASCLQDPAKGWTFENVKVRPYLEMGERDDWKIDK